MRRILKKVFIGLAVLLIGVVAYFSFPVRRSDTMIWGVSFSKTYAESLGLDWRQAYLALLDDLGVTNFRLGSYWSEIEKTEGIYDFTDLDFMVGEASRRGRKIIVTLGLRQPRWPECHEPGWARGLASDERGKRVSLLIEKVVNRYKNNPSIIAWQLENEFFVKWFGNCPPGDEKILLGELNLLKSLDSRPVILTDSGELSLWWKTASLAEVFGTTMYRKVYAPWGVSVWPYPASYYLRLGNLIKIFSGFKKMIIAELQAEPWAKTTLVNDSTETNYLTFSPGQFDKNIAYAKKTGINEAYLWGAEWWYYMKTARGVDKYWIIAKSLWQREKNDSNQKL